MEMNLVHMHTHNCVPVSLWAFDRGAHTKMIGQTTNFLLHLVEPNGVGQKHVNGEQNEAKPQLRARTKGST